MNPVSNLYYFLGNKSKNCMGINSGVIPFYHLMIVFEGEFTFVVNGQEVVVKGNDALILPPETLRQRLPFKGEADYVLFNFMMEKDYALSSYMLFENGVSPFIRNVLNSFSYKYYIDTNYPYAFYRVPGTDDDNSVTQSKTKTILQNILNCVVLELFESFNYTTKNQHVISALKYINDHITEPLSLNDVCREVHLSKEYTARIFRKEMNMTITDYITQQKLILAKDMLASDDISLVDIAEKIGYREYNYFSRLFKKQYGISPLKMKSEMKTKNRV